MRGNTIQPQVIVNQRTRLHRDRERCQQMKEGRRDALQIRDICEEWEHLPSRFGNELRMLETIDLRYGVVAAVGRAVEVVTSSIARPRSEYAKT